MVVIEVVHQSIDGIAVVGLDGLDALLDWCDAVVICAPRTAETKGLLGAERIARLRDGTILVNVSRGGIVDELALLDRIRAGTITAALDVFEEEPLPPGSLFWNTRGAIVTPHVAGYGVGYMERAVEHLLANVARLERGEPLEGLVDREAGY